MILENSLSNYSNSMIDLNKEVDDFFLLHYVPPSVVIDQRLDVLQFRGSTSLFLEHLPGNASLNLLKMIRPELMPGFKNAFQTALSTGKRVRKKGLNVLFREKTYPVSLEVVPLVSSRQNKFMLVIFEESPATDLIKEKGHPVTVQASPKSQEDLLTANNELKNLNRELQERIRQLMATYKDNKNESEKNVRSLNYTLQQLQQELEWSTNELEQVSYIASHDLQEPLRKIITFSDRLQERYTSLLDEPGKGYIEKITYSAQHLARLIDDLLKFIKTTRVKEQFTRTNLNTVAHKVLQDLEASIHQKNAKVYYETLPVIEAIPLQMEQLFYNLLTNALTFIHHSRPPVITITVKKVSGDRMKLYKMPEASLLYYEIQLKDNGLGFKQEYASQIFSVFKRLHDKQEFPGTGIGLAICQKIVANHRGKIFAESAEETGSSFYIILPAKQSREAGWTGVEG